ncbi:hypothetical protein CI102_4919 [Trichoderma harzianum]|nr:hypothetical protein CI102_4919 [Trichoderma harzianum]
MHERKDKQTDYLPTLVLNSTMCSFPISIQYMYFIKRWPFPFPYGSNSYMKTILIPHQSIIFFPCSPVIRPTTRLFVD